MEETKTGSMTHRRDSTPNKKKKKRKAHVEMGTKHCKAVPYGHTLILGKQSHLIRQTPRPPPNPGHYFPPRHISPLLNPERMGGDTAHSTTPRSTHSHKTRLSFLRRTPIRTRHILHTRSTKYSYLNRRYMEQPQRNKYPATGDTHILP